MNYRYSVRLMTGDGKHIVWSYDGKSGNEVLSLVNRLNKGIMFKFDPGLGAQDIRVLNGTYVLKVEKVT